MLINITDETLSDVTHFPSLDISGIVGDDGRMLEVVNMKIKIKNALSQHNHKIYSSEKCGFFTDVDDPTRKDGLRRIRKCSEEKLMLALVDWYEKKNNTKSTLTNVYELWIDSKQTPTNESNIKRIQAAWNSYYIREPISQTIISTPMNELTTSQLVKWGNDMLKKNTPVDAKKFNRMFGIINNCFRYAISDDDNAFNVTVNTWERAKEKLNPSLISKPCTPPDEEQIFTNDEIQMMDTLVHDDLRQRPNGTSSAGLQILFLLQTGLRIGECCGLKWSDIKNGELTVQRQATNETVKENTKTSAGRRTIHLTKKALEILDEVNAFNQRKGYTAEWVFQSGNPNYDYRLSYDAANLKLKRLCKELDTVNKTPHKLRKTCLSILLDDPNISKRTVQRFAGHSDIRTTEAFYHFERRSRAEQAAAIDRALDI